MFNMCEGHRVEDTIVHEVSIAQQKLKGKKSRVKCMRNTIAELFGGEANFE